MYYLFFVHNCNCIDFISQLVQKKTEKKLEVKETCTVNYAFVAKRSV